MHIDPMPIVAFLHVVLFAYWLGTDLAVLQTSMAANRRGLSTETRSKIREVNALIDMAPRTCLVLMIPVGLTLASRWGLPINGLGLAAAWVGALAWVWLVWMVHWTSGRALGTLLWRIDLAIRIVATFGFLSLGAWCLATGAPIASHWLATKILLFGVLVLLGVIVRIQLLARPQPAPGPVEFEPAPFWTPIRLTVFTIWFLLAVMAYLGVAKPF
jgi:hypothetical protein